MVDHDVGSTAGMGVLMLQDNGGYMDAEGEVDDDVVEMKGLVEEAGKGKGKEKEQEQEQENERKREKGIDNDTNKEKEAKERKEEEEEEEEGRGKGQGGVGSNPEMHIEDGKEGSEVRAMSSLSLVDHTATEVLPEEGWDGADGQASTQGDEEDRSAVRNDSERFLLLFIMFTLSIPSSDGCPDHCGDGHSDGHRQRK